MSVPVKQRILSALTAFLEYYNIAFPTGSAAVYALAEGVLADARLCRKLKPSELATLQKVLDTEPNDIDLCVWLTAMPKHIDIHKAAPPSIVNFERLGGASKSAKYINVGVKIDIIYVQSLSARQCVEFGGISYIKPSKIAAEYGELLGLRGRDEELDGLRMKACEILASILEQEEEKKDTRDLSPARQNRLNLSNLSKVELNSVRRKLF